MITITRTPITRTLRDAINGPTHVELTYKQWLFPGGEVGVGLDAQNLRYLAHRELPHRVVARLQTAADVLELMMVVDALRRLDPAPVRLVMPYVPYGRQDRVCSPGEALSLKVFAGLVNALNCERVTIFDPHSDAVALAMDRVEVVTQLQVINRFEAFLARALRGVTLVSPDAGANKKTAELARYLGHADLIRADKVRELATGAIKETVVYADDLRGQDVVIADDICDGGRTFIELARVLKAKGANKVILYVTHALFSRGTRPLFDGGIDEVFITDAWGGLNQHHLGTEDRPITTLNLTETFPT
jgi:ribose-phosphate pyrophosphokinase